MLLAVVWEDVGFSPRDIGLLIAIYGVPLVAMSLFSGPLANRIGILQTSGSARCSPCSASSAST